MSAPVLDASTQTSGWPVVGHERAIEMLRRSLRQGRLSHAYLFTGPEGVGKRTLALALAMTINCQVEPPAGQELPDVPCGLCTSCQRTLRGTHPDFVEINLQTQAQAVSTTNRGKPVPAKEIKIDAIREMQASVGLRPYSGRRRVYIIGDADRLNEEASNCMLKTLEEPPAHTVLILLAGDAESLLPTISSRCMHVPLRPLSRERVRTALVELWGADEEQAETLAALSGGRLGYAVSVLGDGEKMSRRRAALEELAVLSRAPVAERIDAASRYAKVFTDARSELYEMLDVWEAWWRDVLIMRAPAPELVTNIDQVQALRSVSARVPVERASATIELIQRTRQQLLENVNPRLALEAVALSVP